MAPSSFQLSARSVSKSHGGFVVLDGVSVRVGPRSRIGLLGPNGVGKSTLLRILAGADRPDTGRVERSPASLTVGLLDQEPGRASDETLAAFLSRRTGVGLAATELEAAAAHMTDELASIQSYNDALDRFGRLGGHDLGTRSAVVTADLGLPPLGSTMHLLSGGQRTRAALAAIMLAHVDVLLLDEPTNNLDLEALRRLETFVQTFAGGIVMVSHDRAFLDACVESFIELDPFTRGASEFAGSWSAYVAERELRRRQQHKAHEAAMSVRARLQRRANEMRQEATRGVGRAKSSGESDKFIRSAKVAGAQGHASGAAKLDRKIERIEVPDAPRERWTLHMDLAPATRGSDVVARLLAAIIERGGFRLGPLDLEITRGDRIALLGPNGAGKSTLLHAIAGTLDLSGGSRVLGPSVMAGMLDQDRDAFLPGDDLLSMLGRETGLRGADARRLLATFELGADDVTRPANELSPGERTRASLAVLTARRTNLLLLDEPTNHLDLVAIEQIEQAIASYSGTFVIATHDRRLVETIGVTRTIELLRLPDGLRPPT